MSSQPDYERARKLNPDRFPADPMERVHELEAVVGYLADELAKTQGRSRKEVLADAAKATGNKDVSKLPERKEPAPQKSEDKVQGRDGAEFFAHKERGNYQPISDLSDDADLSQIEFFATAEDAEAKGYVAEEKKDDAPKTAKKKKGK